MQRVQLFAPSDVPSVRPGMELADIVENALSAGGLSLQDGDIVVLAQKIVSKAEGRYVPLREVVPSETAEKLAGMCGKDARLIELILRESDAVIRCVPGVIIVRHKLGLVLANAGIDQSNLPEESDERVLLLPQDPDASAARLREALQARSRARLGVAIIDSLGRAWRMGTCGTCIGAAGLRTLQDLRGEADLYGRRLQSTIVGAGDELAAAASLIMGQAAEGTPLVLVRGAARLLADGSARDLVRPMHQDLFP